MVKIGQKILLADDSTFMRLIIKNILTDCGYDNIIEAENGIEAIEQFEFEKPDLIILDIIMPALSGLETLKKIMKIDKKAKIIMITAVGQKSIMKECNGLGVKGYITKPFDEEKIKETVEKVLGPAKK